MVGWDHQLNGHEFEQAPGDGEGQGSLVCYSPWGGKESGTTKRLNNNNTAVHVLCQIIVFLDKYPRMGLLDDMIALLG